MQFKVFSRPWELFLINFVCSNFLQLFLISVHRRSSPPSSVLIVVGAGQAAILSRKKIDINILARSSCKQGAQSLFAAKSPTKLVCLSFPSSIKRCQKFNIHLQNQPSPSESEPDKICPFRHILCSGINKALVCLFIDFDWMKKLVLIG